MAIAFAWLVRVNDCVTVCVWLKVGCGGGGDDMHMEKWKWKWKLGPNTIQITLRVVSVCACEIWYVFVCVRCIAFKSSRLLIHSCIHSFVSFRFVCMHHRIAWHIGMCLMTWNRYVLLSFSTSLLSYMHDM